MNGHPLIEWRKIKQWVRAAWAESFGIVVAFVLGILLGIVYKQEDIMEDCKYSGTFLVHSQAYNCQRKI
jgi:hypothetical protein